MPKKGETIVEPIPREQVKEWNALVRETREVVEQRDKCIFDLILLAGKVQGSYGENRIGRWSEEAQVSLSQARQYAWLYRRGCNEEFVEKWAKTPTKKKGLSYTVIREIAQFCGGLTSDYAEEYLKWAIDHKATASAVRGYMYEITAPQNRQSEAAKDYKLALRDKQEHEGFSDSIRLALEHMVEENPHVEGEVMGTVITNVDDIQKLKLKAGVIPDDEAEMVERAKRYMVKLRSYRKFLLENKADIAKCIENGHEFSADLKGHVDALLRMVNEINEIEPLDGYEGDDVEIDLGKKAS